MFEKCNHSLCFSFSPVRPQPTSPFKRPLLGGTTGPQFPSAAMNCGMTPMQKLEQMACANSGAGSNNVNGGTPLHSGMLPCIADVRSPDVLHPQDGPCDCLSHPIMVRVMHRLYSFVKRIQQTRHLLLQPSLSTEELNAEMKNLEGLMKDLNSISSPSALAAATTAAAAAAKQQQQQGINASNSNLNQYNC